MDGLELKPTDCGTPQGGKISPLLANIALHGMENKIKSLASSFDMKRANGYQKPTQEKKNSINLIRYADDFVILHEDIKVINKCVKVITQWLNDMGLELKPSKTRITPSKKAQKQHYQKIATIIDEYKGSSQVALISKLNPIIKGWCNYYSMVVSRKVFERLVHLVFSKLFKWGMKRHPNKGKKWIKNRYFISIGNRNWEFASRTKDNPFPFCLISHSDTEIKRFVKVKGDASPYDGNLVYWSTRMGRHPEMPKRKAYL